MSELIMSRCSWAKTEPSISYHDTEWGVPVFDDQTLFEFLILEGAQAGLSWETVLKKREHYRKVLDQFDPIKISQYDEQKVQALLADPGIIRNRLKIAATLQNAKAFLNIQQEWSSFSQYFWHFVDGQPQINQWEQLTQVPASTPLSDRLSKDLKKRGFNFVGSTICYSLMQAVGMVNDHLITCPRHQAVQQNT